MERVSPVDLGLAFDSGKVAALRGGLAEGKVQAGKIGKSLGSGLFYAVLKDGREIKVRGSGALRVGDSVEVLVNEFDNLAPLDPGLSEGLGQSIQWSAFLPLGFGGKGASARLEVFVEKQPKGLNKKKDSAYFVFTVNTESQGEIQWSIHLTGKQVALQVYAPGENPREKLKPMVRGIENSLKNKGFSLGGATVYLNSPFRIPAGYRLNLRG